MEIHLTLSGLIILQPVEAQQPEHDRHYKWRVLVPDFANSQHHHDAFVAVAGDELKPKEAGIRIVDLKDMEVFIADVKAAGNASYPAEIIQLGAACDPSSATAGKIKKKKDVGKTPALELWVEDAEIHASGVDNSVEWQFDWPGSGKKPGKHGFVAEEVCLKFTTTRTELALDFKVSGKVVESLRLEPAPGAGTVEVAVRNITTDSIKHHQKDPHFHMYRDLLKTPPGQFADLTNSMNASGAKTDPHGHRLQYVIHLGKIVKPAPPASSNEERGSHEGVKGTFSMTGSNCPPGGGHPYP